MTFEVSGAEVRFNDGSVLRFAGTIGDAVELDGTVIVRLVYEIGILLGVYGVRGSRVVWQVKKRPDAFGAYVKLAVLDKKLYVWDIDGFRYQLEPATGAVLEAVFMK